MQALESTAHWLVAIGRYVLGTHNDVSLTEPARQNLQVGVA